MTDAPAPAAPSTPKHVLIVAVLAILWNAMGAWNYIATQFRVEAVMSQYSQEQLDYYYGFPSWAIAFSKLVLILVTVLLFFLR